MAELPSNLHLTAEPTKRQRARFSLLDGRSVAVILRQDGKQCVFRGTGIFQRDDLLGDVLFVTATESESVDAKLIISEREWKGRVFPDLEHGCESCLISPQDQPRTRPRPPRD